MDKKNVKSSIWDSKILWAVISLLASTLLWVYVTTTVGELIPKTFDGVKVVFKGEDILRDKEGLLISNISANTVTVRIRATRREIAKLSSDNLTAVVDVSKFNTSANYNQLVTIDFPLGSDTNSIDVVSTFPQNISFSIEKASTKTVDLNGQFVGTVVEGFAAQPMEFNPETVKITGPQSEIDKVAYAWVEVDRDNVDKTIQFNSTYVLKDSEGKELQLRNITLEPETVSVKVPINATKEVPLTVDWAGGGGATSENVKITCNPSTITIAGDAEILAGINKISLATIDLSSFELSLEETYPIVLDNGITNVTGIKEAKVTIKIIGLETGKFNVTNISTINVPAGREASVVTENVEVILRGNKDVLSKIKANNIRVVADLADLGDTTGVFQPNVKVYVDGYTGVDAIGESEYEVYVKLK
ncbi:MAG: hypothetical protein GXY01_09835 [Clostridiales bacterium]|jgi:YbbR domain-containing protein|nr:hypothetical protein [Clostridiales bacterium]